MKNKLKKPFINKKSFKRRSKKCIICGENRYEVLDVHRWNIPGAKNGKYTTDNCTVVCVKCHRLIHNDKIKIIGIFNSTTGKLLNYIDLNGKEQFSKF